MPEITERLSTALADRYKIESHLGEGGMANVYLAHDLKHDRKVAVKVLRPELAAVLGAERFVQEIKTTANLQHPHILPLFDSGEADSFLYYVMPFIDGETLRPTTRTVSWAEALLVKRMGRGTTCGSVCFLPLALVMHDNAKVGFPILRMTIHSRAIPLRRIILHVEDAVVWH